jgi:hypothetical protein
MRTVALGYDVTRPAVSPVRAQDAADRRAFDQFLSEADNGAAQLATDLESISDEAEILSPRLAVLRAELTRQRVVLDQLRSCRRRTPTTPLALCRRP